MSEVSNLNSDYGYYNIIMNNYSGNVTPTDPNGFPNTFLEAAHIDNRTQPILSNMNDWELRVERFKIPGVTIPLMIFLDNGVPTTANNYLSPYYMAFTRGVDDSDITPAVQVIFSPQTPTNIPPFNGPPYNRFIFYYTAFMQLINNALATLWVQASTNPAYDDLFVDGVTAHTPPYFALDSTTNYFKLVCPTYDTLPDAVPTPFQTTDLDFNPNGINLLMSSNLFYYFTGFPEFFYGQQGIPTVMNGAQPSAGQTVYLNYKLLLNINPLNLQTLPPFSSNDEYNNVNVVYQDYASISLWQTLTRVIITTDAPVEYESVTIKGPTSGQPYTMNVLTDYEIPALDSGQQRQYLYYNAITNSRWLNFKASGYLDRFNVRIAVEFNNLQTVPLFIPPTFESTVKVAFRRRKAYDLLQYTKHDATLSDFR